MAKSRAALALALVGCAPLHPSLNAATIASPTPPRYVAPALEAGLATGRLYLFGGYEWVVGQQATPSYDPVVGASIRLWP